MRQVNPMTPTPRCPPPRHSQPDRRHTFTSCNACEGASPGVVDLDIRKLREDIQHAKPCRARGAERVEARIADAAAEQQAVVG